MAEEFRPSFKRRSRQMEFGVVGRRRTGPVTMTMKMVLRVNMNCPKCKSQVLKAVTKLSGIDQITVDGEKGVLTVIGDVDPVLVTTKLRKTGKTVQIVSVGPPKKLDSPCSDVTVKWNSSYPPPCGCQLVTVSYLPFSSNDDGFCSIL